MALTSKNIQDIVSRKRILYKNFLGVFSINNLPRILIRRPAYLIINLQPDYLAGSHWVAISFTSNGSIHYFDSFGMIPPPEISLFLDRNSKWGWTFNRVKLQGDLSFFCGYYCILFIYYSSKNKLNHFYNLFVSCNSTETSNDNILMKELKRSHLI